MKTQVLIPAQNESDRLGRLLEALPADVVEPIVAVNGSQDETAEVALSYTSRVYEYEEAGKLPAIQGTLRQLGRRALEPIILLDADTIPFRPVYWRDLMVRAMEPNADHPTVVSGPVLYTKNEGTRIAPLLRSIGRYGQTLAVRSRVRHTGVGGVQYGPNMGVHLHNRKTLDAVLDLPHIWPEEDVAQTQVVVESHPEAKFEQILHPFATASTPRPLPMQPLMDWLLRPEETHETERQAYRASRPANSITYQEWLDTIG